MNALLRVYLDVTDALSEIGAVLASRAILSFVTQMTI